MIRYLLILPMAAVVSFGSTESGYFTQNSGQWQDGILFRASTAGSDILLTSRGITVLTPEGDRVEYTIQSSPQPIQVIPGSIAPHGTNYFPGNDPSLWVTDVPSFSEVRYRDGQSGGEMVLSLNSQGLSCDFPEHDGEMTLRRSHNGHMETAVSSDCILVPASTTECASSLEALFSTYLGGSGEDRSYSVAFDQSGNVFITGRTNSLDFPLQNPYQSSFSGGTWDIFVTCISADGSQFLYSTYIGGSADENGYGIIVDDEGCAYVTGPTESTDFPLQNAYQPALSGVSDAFVLKLSSSGNSLLYSTYLGGSGTDNGRDIAVDSIGGAYITGTTSSPDFPLQNPWQATLGGGSDAFFTKLSPVGNVIDCSTFIGGASDEYGEGIAISPGGRATLTGTTASTDFPVVAPFQGSYGGGTDAYLVKLTPSGETALFSTYLGGSNFDSGQNVSCNQNHIAVTGFTESTDFPLQNPVQGTLPGSSAAFVSKMNDTGTELDFSTYLGGSGDDQGRDMALSEDGSIFVTGYTSSQDFPVVDPWQEFYGGGANDCFLLRISPGDTLEYSTYLGGSGNDSSRGLALLADGSVAVTGGVFSQDFPMLNPLQGTFGGGATDCFVSVFVGYQQSAENGELITGNGIVLGVSPNPAGSQLSVTVHVPCPAPVTLGIYDLAGRQVETILSNDQLEAGAHYVSWVRGEMPAGVYILRASAPGFPPANTLFVIR